MQTTTNQTTTNQTSADIIANATDEQFLQAIYEAQSNSSHPGVLSGRCGVMEAWQVMGRVLKANDRVARRTTYERAALAKTVGRLTKLANAGYIKRIANSRDAAKYVVTVGGVAYLQQMAGERRDREQAQQADDREVRLVSNVDAADVLAIVAGAGKGINPDEALDCWLARHGLQRVNVPTQVLADLDGAIRAAFKRMRDEGLVWLDEPRAGVVIAGYHVDHAGGYVRGHGGVLFPFIRHQKAGTVLVDYRGRVRAYKNLWTAQGQMRMLAKQGVRCEVRMGHMDFVLGV